MIILKVRVVHYSGRKRKYWVLEACEKKNQVLSIEVWVRYSHEPKLWVSSSFSFVFVLAHELRQLSDLRQLRPWISQKIESPVTKIKDGKYNGENNPCNHIDPFGP